jgi:hypothetical protein
MEFFLLYRIELFLSGDVYTSRFKANYLDLIALRNQIQVVGQALERLRIVENGLIFIKSENAGKMMYVCWTIHDFLKWLCLWRMEPSDPDNPKQNN